MPKFSYTAKKISGEEINGTLEATDKFTLARSLRSKGFTLISSEELKKGESLFFNFSIRSFFFIRGVPISEKMVFARNIAVMIESGLSIARALDILANQTKSQNFKTVLISLNDEIRKGQSLSESMKTYPKVFSSLFVSMVKAGEEGGKLSEAFKLIGHQLEREYSLLRKVRGAMVYPAIIILAMIVIGILMLIYVVPTLISTFEDIGAELPSSTRIIISISNFIINQTILFLLTLFLIVAGSVWFFRNDFGKKVISSIFLRLPVFRTLTQKINSARTARTLGSLISSGVDIVHAIEITGDVLQNYRYKKVLAEAKKKVLQGDPLSDTFKKEITLYPLLVGEMMIVGEETGKLSDMLTRLADFYEDEVEAITKDISTIIEPVLMIVIGVVVGFFAVSMITPMYSVLGGI